MDERARGRTGGTGRAACSLQSATGKRSLEMKWGLGSKSRLAGAGQERSSGTELIPLRRAQPRRTQQKSLERF